MDEKEKMIEEKFSRDVLTQITNQSTVSAIPDEIVNNELVIEWNSYLFRLGKTEDELLKEQPHTKDWFWQMHKARVVEGLKTTFLLHNIAQLNNIEVSEKEVKAHIETKVRESKDDKKKQDEMIKVINNSKSEYGQVKRSLINQKTIEYVMNRCAK